MLFEAKNDHCQNDIRIENTMLVFIKDFRIENLIITLKKVLFNRKFLYDCRK